MDYSDLKSEFDKIMQLAESAPSFAEIDPTSSTSLGNSGLQTVLEKKARKIIASSADLEGQEIACTMDAILNFLDHLSSQIGDVEFTQCFRGGRRYLTINHRMGNVGNMFFRNVLNNLKIGDQHIVERQNGICSICRL